MSYSEFFNAEFANLDLNDARLKRRAVFIGNELIKSPGSCIQEIFATKNEARCSYDFFSNSKVKWLNLLESHQEQTLNRIQNSASDFFYVIQDSTFYNYTNHKAKIDIGTIGKQGRFTQYGFLQHTAFCISGDDLPLGVLELDFIGYDDDPKLAPHRDGFEDIASSRWRRFQDQSYKKLKNSNKIPIMLCDREADFFEFLDDLHEDNYLFVIRSKWDRPTGLSGRTRRNKFSELFNTSPCLGSIEIVVIDPYTHAEEKRMFHIKALEDIMLPPIHRGAGHPQNNLPPIKINVVEAFDGQNRWVLLTNLPVRTLKEATFVVESYKKRWHIESFHKVLKTAYKADHVYLHSSRESIQNLLTMINIAACQTYWLIHQSRKTEYIPAICCFNSQEIEALSIYLNKRNQPLKSSLQDIYYQIAELGGYKNYTNKHPPGILTIYRGIKKLNDITKMYVAIMSTKT